ncbi:YitT family protein [Cellulomonas rhizosphaerae]|uniref:YitT family protein n=1 Tax=Cellulomonas rhizosphaerae TaxID=2293719 RepID=A0A413RHD0_9CELL|nr:YitT family protein [Cellulomonas rhizosphaerae]RHA37526.1 YitT family protein [Cellulomonas rhizosphaerae]
MTSATQTAPTIDAAKHSRLEDALGIFIGTFVLSLGLFLLRSVDAVTGGTAGLSLLLVHVVELPFGVLFALVNLPFLLLAIHQRGWGFTLRTALCIALVSTMSGLHAQIFGAVDLPTAYGVLAGNVLAGVGLLILFRHGSSVGGFTIVALILQDRAGWRAGYVQMVLDTVVVLAAFTVVGPGTVLLSAAGAFLLNLIVALNHRPGRYLGY